MFRQLLIVLSLLIPIHAIAQSQSEDTESSKTLAPYFILDEKVSDAALFPLKGTKVDVNIAGTIAQVALTQTYRNESKQPIEARYVFPGSTRAAVSAMRMKIGERIVFAEIKEKAEAKNTYEKAKQEGKTASLLEQHRANVFEMNVANIMPQQEVEVTLTYSELLSPTAGIYQFVFPAVVGPRFSNQLLEKAGIDESWVQNPYLSAGTKTPSTFDLTLKINAGMSIKEINSPSHAISIEYASEQSASAKFQHSETSNGNRDFIVNYRLAGSAIQTGVMLYSSADENFFAATLEPPTAVKQADIPPRDYIFVVDVSGSMHGFPINTAKQLMNNLLSGLRPIDSFNLLLFSGSSEELSQTSIPASRDNIDRAIAMLERRMGGGGTMLLPALKHALAYPASENKSRSVIVVTDGYVDVETETFDLIRDNLNKFNVFAFGIGSSVNRLLIEGMAHAGKGEAYVVTNFLGAISESKKFQEFVAAPLLTKVKLEIDGFDAYDLEPAVVPDLFAQRPITVVGKYRGKPKGTIKLKGFVGSGQFESTLDLANYQENADNSALRSLWARERIRLLGDYYKVSPNDQRKKIITDLGLKYSLLTQFTSFVAVDQEIRRKADQELKSVQQPLPLPEGVSNFAVGGGFIPTAPEPETWALIIVGIFVALWARFGRHLLGSQG